MIDCTISGPGATLNSRQYGAKYVQSRAILRKAISSLHFEHRALIILNVIGKVCWYTFMPRGGGCGFHSRWNFHFRNHLGQPGLSRPQAMDVYRFALFGTQVAKNMAALLKISALLSRSSHDKKGNNDQGQAHPLLGAKPFFEKQIADEYRQQLTTNN